MPRQFGPVTAMPVSLDRLLQLDGEPLALLVLQLAEAGGDDGRGAGAGGGGVADHLHGERAGTSTSTWSGLSGRSSKSL